MKYLVIKDGHFRRPNGEVDFNYGFDHYFEKGNVIEKTRHRYPWSDYESTTEKGFIQGVPDRHVVPYSALSKLLYLFITLFLFFPNVSKAQNRDCGTHKIYCKIVEIKPDVNKDWAFELSNILHKKSQEYNTDPMVSVAIAAQENMFRKNNHRTEIGLVFNSDQEKYVKKRFITDIGLFQIHINTAINYNFDLNKLVDDTNYNIEAHFQILKDKIRLCSDIKDSWSCYHSTTEKYRKKYKEDVERYL